MAARFFARLPADANVVVETPPELMSLFEHNFRALRFERFTHWRPARDVDVHLPITQLATIAGIRTAAEIDGSPYLRAVPEQVDAWRRRLGGAPNVRRVGVVWHGNVRNARDRWRAAPLRAWAPLARLEGVQFHALQVDATDAELRDAPIRLEPTHARIGDMADTAALMTALDAVVSVDTATAHLAGALGCPVWLPNPLVSDYRWGVDRADSPWYSSMRVVRQSITFRCFLAHINGIKEVGIEKAGLWWSWRVVGPLEGPFLGHARFHRKAGADDGPVRGQYVLRRGSVLTWDAGRYRLRYGIA
jgi:hypothetical protein